MPYRHLTWSTDFNLSFNRNKVLALGPTGDAIRSGTGVGETNITVLGKPLGNFYGYQQLGVFKDQADLDSYPHDATARPGDVKFADINNDGKITADDRTILGNNQPDFIYGMTNTLSYKGIVIEVAFRADLIVQDRVLVELKAIETILPVHKAQVLSYIRETGHQVGLLINFHVPRLVDGVNRLLNDRTNPV